MKKYTLLFLLLGSLVSNMLALSFRIIVLEYKGNAFVKDIVTGSDEPNFANHGTNYQFNFSLNEGQLFDAMINQYERTCDGFSGLNIRDIISQANTEVLTYLERNLKKQSVVEVSTDNLINNFTLSSELEAQLTLEKCDLDIANLFLEAQRMQIKHFLVKMKAQFKEPGEEPVIDEQKSNDLDE